MYKYKDTQPKSNADRDIHVLICETTNKKCIRNQCTNTKKIEYLFFIGECPRLAFSIKIDNQP